MSGYAGAGRAVLLRDNKQIFLFQQETGVAGKASIAVQVERVNRSFYPWGISFQIYFTDVNGNPSDPGAFEMDVQSSDIDADAQYVTIDSILHATDLNATFVGRIELQTFFAKYIRVLPKTVTNAVYVNVLVTR